MSVEALFVDADLTTERVTLPALRPVVTRWKPLDASREDFGPVPFTRSAWTLPDGTSVYLAPGLELRALEYGGDVDVPPRYLPVGGVVLSALALTRLGASESQRNRAYVVARAQHWV